MNNNVIQGIRWFLVIGMALALGRMVMGQTTSSKLVGPRARYSVVPARSWESSYARPVASGEADLKLQLLEDYLNKRGQEGWVFKNVVKDHSNNIDLYVFEKLE